MLGMIIVICAAIVILVMLGVLSFVGF